MLCAMQFAVCCVHATLPLARLLVHSPACCRAAASRPPSIAHVGTPRSLSRAPCPPRPCLRRRGGGVSHGPVPRSHEHSLQKRVRRLGLQCALSAKAWERRLVVVETLRPSDPKTVRWAGWLGDEVDGWVASLRHGQLAGRTAGWWVDLWLGPW